MKRPLIPDPDDSNRLLVVLANGKGYALIDREDAEVVGQHNWQLKVPKNGRTRYAQTSIRKADGSKTTRALHRLVASTMGLSEKYEVDHKNQNGLDCTRRNLRAASSSDNKKNVRRRGNNTSGYKGVTWHAGLGYWVAQLSVNKKKIHHSYHKDPIQAARAYDRAAREHFGEFAVLNFV